MDLFSISNKLDSNLWEKKPNPPSDVKKIGYKEYHVTRSNIEGKSLTYYLSTDAGDVTVATLHGLAGKKDPLMEVNKCYLLIEESGDEELKDSKTPGLIKGIVIDDDWVEYRR